VTDSHRYDYKSPSSFNLVTVLVILGIAAAAYGGIKFGKVLWQGWKVDEALDEQKILLTQADVARLDPGQRDATAADVIARSVEKLREMGIEDQPDQPIDVYYSEDFTTLHAEYKVVVTHPVGGSTVIAMHRKVKVP
jgi:hypothetical protein